MAKSLRGKAERSSNQQLSEKLAQVDRGFSAAMEPARESPKSGKAELLKKAVIKKPAVEDEAVLHLSDGETVGEQLPGDALPENQLYRVAEPEAVKGSGTEALDNAQANDAARPEGFRSPGDILAMGDPAVIQAAGSAALPTMGTGVAGTAAPAATEAVGGLSLGALAGGGLAVAAAGGGGGGLAVAAAGGGGGGLAVAAAGGGASIFSAVENFINGTLSMGPAIAGNGLSVAFYAADGTTLIATAIVNADGTYSANIGSYTGALIAKVADSSSGADYMDEATGVAKDLSAVLMTVVVASGGVTTVNINPITTIAAIKAGLSSDGTGSIANVADIQTANDSVATLFGLGNIVTTTPTTTLDSGFNGSDGLSSSEKYGAILAALSGADTNTVGGTQAVIDAIAAGIDITTPGTPTLATSSQSMVLAGANTAAANNSANNAGLQTMVNATLGMESTPKEDATVSAMTPTQIANLTLGEVTALTPVQISLLGANIQFLSPMAIASLSNDQIEVLTQDQVSALTKAQLFSLSAVQIEVLAATGIVVDISSPTANIAISDLSLKAGESTTVTITFSEEVSGFDINDLKSENGELSALTMSTTNPKVWTATFTPAANVEDTTNVVSLAATYTDVAGNSGTAKESATYGVDNVAPTAEITMDKTSFKSGESATVTITFSEAVSMFELEGADFTTPGGSLSNLIQSTADPKVWTATFAPDANVEDGSNVISLATTYTDVAGNAGTTASSVNYAVDTAAPTGTLAFQHTGPLNAGAQVIFQIKFNEPVKGFGLDDLVLGSNVNLTGVWEDSPGTQWLALLTASADIEDPTTMLTISNTYFDAIGNTGVAVVDHILQISTDFSGKADGGGGVDTLRVVTSGELSFTAALFSHIEKIDLSTNISAQVLNIRASDILSAGELNVFNNTTFGGSVLGESVAKHQLLINAGGEDTVKLDALGWSTTQSVTVNGHAYDIYNNSSANVQLLIESLATVSTVL